VSIFINQTSATDIFVSDRRWPQLGWPARGPWLEDLLEIVGLEVMAEGIGAAVQIWSAEGRE